MPQQLAFVVTDGSARIRSAERQVIRRHCMRQRNKKPGSRRSKREAARIATQNLHKSEKQGQKSSSEPEPIPTKYEVTPRSELYARERRRQVSSKECIIPSPPSDWALFQFPEELDISSQKLMHQYYIRNPIRDMLFPFKYFGILVDFHEDPLWCFQTLYSEKLYFRAILLLTSASNDLISRQPLSNNTYRCLRRIIPLLNDRLSNVNAYKHDITLYVVSILASIAILFGDYDTAQTHATGLSEIIRLRGGFGATEYNPVIQFSVDRLNFSSLLVTKRWIPLYNSSIWKRPVFPAEVIDLFHSEGMLSIDGLIEPDLLEVFHNLQYTTIVFNKHYYEGTPVDGMFIRQCLGFVHSSLIELEGRLKNHLSGCLRLGMMAFLATTFRLPDLYKQHYCENLAKKLHHSYIAVKASTPDLQRTIDIWLIMMLLISIDNMDESKGCADWEPIAVSGQPWDEIRRHLKQVMWIDSFHDDIGKRAFETLMTQI